mgnify:CR=1 FL=1
MNEMIKAERNKICSRKQTRMLFLAGVVLIVAYFFLSTELKKKDEE